MFYRVLQWLLRIATRVFYRRLEVVGLGNVPAEGAVLSDECIQRIAKHCPCAARHVLDLGIGDNG